MKFQISLKLYIILFFVSLTAALVIGYSMLSAHFYVRGMDNIVISDMVKAADSFLAENPPEKRSYPARIYGYTLAADWSTMPGDILDESPEPPREENELMKIDKSGWLAPPDRLTFAMRYQKDGKTFFIAKQVNRKAVPSITGENAAESLRILLLISVLTSVIIALVLWVSLKQVARPVTAMRNWARSLQPDSLKEQPPDFHYPELNELAQMIRNSLSSVQDSLDREHRFLRHASHELRTPISVLRNNVELMRRLQTDSVDKSKQYQKKVIARLDRASLTMQHITETLLWLSRDSGEAPLTTPVALANLLHSLVDELQYLVTNKNLEVKIETDPSIINLPEVPTRIVLGNLIRNAFQHTWEGRVFITQKQDCITIINEQLEPMQGSEDLGFGLGLQLTSQLTAKLGWEYENTATTNGHTVTIRFNRGHEATPEQDA